MNTVAISFLIYSAGIAAIGILATRFSKNSESDFLLANRGLGSWVTALSAAASAESGWVTLGLVGFAYKTGIGALWIVPGTLLAFLFNWFVLGPHLRQASVNRNSLTVIDVIASKYSHRSGKWIRLIGIIIILTMLTAYVAAQLNASGKTFTGTFQWHHSVGVLLGAGIVLLYTVTGGFRAVAWTDVVQSVFMIAAVTLIPTLLIVELGGLSSFWSKLAAMEGGDQFTNVFGGKSGYALLGFLVLWLRIPLGNPGQPHMMSRLMAAKDDNTIRRSGVISTLWVMVLFTGAILVGISARVYYGTIADPENALPMIATDANILSGVLGGFLLAAILSAICSTADSQLLVAGSAVSHDLLHGVFRSKAGVANRLKADRIAVVLVGGIATLIALAQVRSVFSFVLDYGWAGLGAGIGPALIMTLLWKRTTGPGVIAGMIVGLATVVIWNQIPGLSQVVYTLVPAFFASLLTISIVSLVGQTQESGVEHHEFPANTQLLSPSTMLTEART